MKQIVQRLRDGRVELLDVPRPELSPEGVLVDVRASLLSAGTERSKIETGRQSLAAKARARPDQVRKVLDKARTDGVQETVRAVRSRLDQASGLGYSAAGVVLAVGARVPDLAPGDRVACGGGDYAVHAEVDHVPSNLCVRLPGNLSFEEGAFATIGSIALHGVRQADVRIGEKVAVIGLGLVGQLAAQLLRAAGCTVLGVDLAPKLVSKALESGAVDIAFERDSVALAGASGDCDAVLITAATKSADPIELAAELCRDRGRVVVLGDVGMDVPRERYYGKELELRLSRSYGPGRYDREYEERGLDYPVGYVRWTERRNMAAFVEFVASGKVGVRDLVSERVAIDEAPAAYERLLEADASPLGIVLEYGPSDAAQETLEPQLKPGVEPQTRMAGVIGAGSFAQRTLIPALRDAGFALGEVASASGVSARAAADRFSFKRATTVEEILSNPSVGLVAIATRHGSHAGFATAALDAGKHVFVEKPPCLSFDELADLRRARTRAGKLLAVGFNRRHAPLAAELRSHVSTAGPLQILYRVNAGALPEDHWLNDPEEGGGRLLGEGCHFVDFACWLVGAVPARVSCLMRPERDRPLATAQSFTVVADFPDGSLATIVYSAGGNTRLPKEYVEVHGGGRSAVLDDFRTLLLYEGRRPRKLGRRSQDKGHQAQLVQLRGCLETADSPPDPDPLDSMAATLAALVSAATAETVQVGTADGSARSTVTSALRRIQ